MPARARARCAGLLARFRPSGLRFFLFRFSSGRFRLIRLLVRSAGKDGAPGDIGPVGKRGPPGKDGVPDKLVAEVADLWFRTLVVLAAHGLKPAHVLAELERREGMSGLEEFALRKVRDREQEGNSNP